MKKKIIAFFNFVSIAAAEEHPLRCQTSQSVDRLRYCGVQTLPLKMHYGGEKLGGNSSSCRILTNNEVNLTFLVPNYGAKFHRN